ncbi:MAG: NAD-dependent deacylase [Chloroflexi bacterium]|nr:NAD-dependent deacylase [Chloroflexota bacterium]
MLFEDNIAHAADLIINATRVVALTGAGISTPSGIPDFRSPGSGLWEKADPFVVASLEGFLRNPNAFYDWIKPLIQITRSAQPNAAHIALAELEARGKLRAVITQNIDNLHQRAGSRRVLEVHGNARTATCVQCYTQADGDAMLEKFLVDEKIPVCEVCGGTMKPNVILFGEMLPARVMEQVEAETKLCDVMIVAGSSLEVAPVCDLPRAAKKCGGQIIIVNHSPTYADKHAAVVIHQDVAMVLPKIVERINRVQKRIG